MFSGRSLIYSKNNKGPSTEPWGTPELIGISDELSPSSTTVWERPVRKAFIQDRVLTLAPCWWSLCNSFKWFTLSNALLKSSKIRSVCRSWEVLRASSSTSWISWVLQDLLSRKPYMRSYRIPFYSKCLDRFEATMCSITLQNACQWYGAVVNGNTFIHLFEGPDLSLVISRRVLRETGQFHCLGFLRQWVWWSPVLMPCLDSGCKAVLWCQTQI